MSSRRYLTREQAKSFYDRFGSKQDTQAFYEHPALADMMDHAAFETARAVLELGCGTGALAEKLLAGPLPEHARYTAFDVSETMVRLAGRRARRFGDRVTVELTGGSFPLPVEDAGYDRFVATYVLDLLPPREIRAVLDEAYRVLADHGRLCLVGLTHGRTLPSSLVSRLWQSVHGCNPAWVGGCRPVAVRDYLSPDRWDLRHHRVLAAFAVPSEVVVAGRR
ncbi:MAG: hypothetical protein MAG453_01591 [Calditrichaeota bacterium]|nr:hypothetical protein [Calditrichota bacterium]